MGTILQFMYRNRTDRRKIPPQGASSSDLSLSSPSSSSQPSASRSAERIPKLARNPMKAMPPKRQNASASPLGSTRVARVNNPPERKGPAALPAADNVCARPFSRPSTEWFGAEFVIYVMLAKASLRRWIKHTKSSADVSPPTAATVLISRTTPISNQSQATPVEIPVPSLGFL